MTHRHSSRNPGVEEKSSQAFVVHIQYYKEIRGIIIVRPQAPLSRDYDVSSRSAYALQWSWMHGFANCPAGVSVHLYMIDRAVGLQSRKAVGSRPTCRPLGVQLSGRDATIAKQALAA